MEEKKKFRKKEIQEKGILFGALPSKYGVFKAVVR